jgi:hypothetical protein
MNITPVRSAVVTAALAIGVVAAPVLGTGGGSATVAYTCAAPFGAAHPAVRYSVGQAPATMVAGQTVRLGTAATLALDAATTHQVQTGLGWASVGGTIRTRPSGSRAGLHLSITATTLGNGAGGVTNAPVTGTTILRATTAGSYTVRFGDLGDLVLDGFDAGDQPVSSVEFPATGGFGSCTNDATATPLTDSAGGATVVKVSKDTTTTATTASYSRARKKATGRVKVASRFGLGATGKVAFTLKKGTHAIATHQVSLDDRGVARDVLERDQGGPVRHRGQLPRQPRPRGLARHGHLRGPPVALRRGPAGRPAADGR